jgi:subtilisin family serine protease
MNTKTFIGLIATGLAIMPAPSSSQVLGQNFPSVAQVQGSAMAQRARAAASQLTGISAEGLSVVKESPLADTGITRFKLTDAQGKIYGVSLDSAGNLVSQEALRQAVQTIANKGFVGKLESELANRLGQESNSSINVVFSLKGTPAAPLRGNVQNRAQYEANLQTIKDRNAEIQRPIVNQLRENGQRVIYQSAYASVVVAAVTPSLIQAIATRPDVERVYLERVAAPRLNVSRVVVQADTVNARGLTGSGQSVGVVEAQRIGNHPNLPPAQRILCRPEATTAISGHKTQVAGVIQSTALTNQGIAPAITIIDGIGANFSNSEMIAATDCVIANGASTINMSFGSETNGSFDAFARYVDEVVYNTGRTISVAVSNSCTNKMGSPEIAFNVLAVGAFGDNNTPGFEDDIPACTGPVNFSAFLDPDSPNGDREEPDIVAPGHQIRMPRNGGGFVNSNGTSFAAPHVTGGGGLLVQRKPALFTQAEEVRAIMMASARHNIEGSSQLSDKDGAGGILLGAADTVAASTLSDFYVNDGAASNFPLNRSFTVTAGQKVRVAIAWAHKTPAGNTMTEPTTDLDLTIIDPNGGLVINSANHDNNYEIVEFTAAVSGTYTAQISNFRSSSGTERIGLAISQSDS